jgi:hypothetical protein
MLHHAPFISILVARRLPLTLPSVQPYVGHEVGGEMFKDLRNSTETNERSFPGEPELRTRVGVMGIPY